MRWIVILKKIIQELKKFDGNKQEGEEKKLKHLEFIQATIIRMGANSFLIKNWCITLITSLTTAVLVLSKDDTVKIQIVFGLVFLVLIFWILDSFFLSQERKFRKLYDKVSKLPISKIDFSMKINEFNELKDNQFFSMFSITKILFYIPITSILLVILYILNYG